MIVIIVCVLSVAILGDTSASSQQTASTGRLYTFESEVHSGISNGLDSPATSRISVGVSGHFSISALYEEDTEPSCSLLLLQLWSVKFTPSSETNRLDPEVIENWNGPLLLQLCARRFESILLDPDEDVSTRNLKKAIAALFQYQTLPSQSEEIDVCGSCQVSYERVDDSTIVKRKYGCKVESDATLQAEPIFATIKNFTRQVRYLFDENNLSQLMRATAHDNIDVYSAVRKDLRISTTSTLDIIFAGVHHENENSPFATLHFDSIRSIEEAVHYVTRTLELKLKPDVLYLEMERSSVTFDSLKNTIEMNREHMNESQLGTNRSSTAFLEILNAVLHADEQEIVDVMKDEKNEPILNQLMDVFGCAQTLPVHTAVLKEFNLKNLKKIDHIERYLWAISVNEKPNAQFLRDFLEICQEITENDKLKETMLLTITALAHKTKSEKLKEEVFGMITRGIEMCSQNDECVSSYLRALQNLKYAGAKSLLLPYALTGSRMISTNALKAVYNLPRQSWDDQVLGIAEKIYYQKNRLYDSSARSIAIDILVEAGPTYDCLNHLVRSLQSNTSYETRKYLLQRLQQVAPANETIDQNLRSIMKLQNLFNYNFLAQKGLSNAIQLSILKSENLNASIVTINEVSKSVLKRGHVGVVLEQSGDPMELITLDLFTSGLSSFLWSDDSGDSEEMDESEPLLAGIEIALYGIKMRPFFFFHGHAELMGHIWAGTASEKTPILQALRPLVAAEEIIHLSCGHTVRTNLMGAISFELAGRITFSLWNRNAFSLGEADIAATIVGSVSVSTFGALKELNVKLTGESQINMASDLDFYDEVLFCLRISQPRTAIDYEFEMRQVLVDTKRSIHNRKRISYIFPGSTMNLNKKNNEMCNSVSLNHPKS